MTKKITDFRPQKRNANKHTKQGLRMLEKSVQQDGFIDAQTAAADGEMISGTARLELAGEKFAAIEPIIVESDGTRPVIVVRTDIPSLDDPKARRLSVAANQIAKTDYNPDGDLLKEWGNEDAAIKAMFAADEWREVTGEEKPVRDAEPQTDRAAELLERWGVKLGDLWQIGEHRLICGDCTDAATVARVMEGEKAIVLFTDPPYRMGTQGGDILQQKRLESHERIKDIVDFDPQPFLEMLPTLFDERLCAFVFCNKDLLPDYLLWAKDNKINFNVLVWKKSVVVPFGDSHRPDIEYLVLFRKNAKWNNGLVGVNYSRLLEYNNEQGDHPTIKPADLIQNQLLIVSDSGDVVADTYFGSGSTMVACENLGRKCRAVEVSPAYVAVALERMATAFPSLDIRKLENV